MYTIYVGEKCSDCQDVLNFIKLKELNVETRNIDNSDDEVPTHIFVIPALVSGEKILAYGQQDIIKILERA